MKRIIFILFSIGYTLLGYAQSITLRTGFDVNVNFTGDKQQDQQIFYRVIDSNNNTIVGSTNVTDSSFNWSTNYEIDNLHSSTNDTPNLDYTLIIYGLNYKGYTVAVPIRLNMGASGLNASWDFCGGGYTFTCRRWTIQGSWSYTVSILAGITSNVSENHSDAFNQSNYSCLAYGQPGNEGCPDATNRVAVNITLPYVSPFISVETGSIQTKTKSYAWSGKLSTLAAQNQHY